MKTLFYNSIELPAEVHIVSECFGIDITYEPMGDPDHPAWMSELFNLAKCDTFEEVAVRLTKHNEGYTRKSKFAEREEVNGWISLKEVRNGGGYCYIFLWIFYLVYPVGFSILFIDVGIKKN